MFIQKDTIVDLAFSLIVVNCDSKRRQAADNKLSVFINQSTFALIQVETSLVI